MAQGRVWVIPSTEVKWSEAGHARVQSLFEHARRSIKISLEQWAPGSWVGRTVPEGWEEIFVYDGRLDQPSSGSELTYLLLPPGGGERLQPAAGGCTLVRVSYDDRLFGKHRDSGKHEKTGCTRSYGEFHWQLIPTCQPGNPGARTAELSKSPSGSFVTTLLEAGAGWILAEHDHPVDAVSYCLRGGGLLEASGVRYPRVPHQLALIPSGTSHSFRAGPDGAALLIFVFAPGCIV